MENNSYYLKTVVCRQILCIQSFHMTLLMARDCAICHLFTFVTFTMLISNAIWKDTWVHIYFVKLILKVLEVHSTYFFHIPPNEPYGFYLFDNVVCYFAWKSYSVIQCAIWFAMWYKILFNILVGIWYFIQFYIHMLFGVPISLQLL